MKSFLNLFKKELRDLITLRMLLPFSIVMILMVFMGKVTRSEMKRADLTMTVGIVDLDRSKTSADIIETYKNKGYNVILLTSTVRDEFIKEAAANKTNVVLAIPAGFETAIINKKGSAVEFYSIIKSLSIIQAGKALSIRGLLSVINQQISDSYIEQMDRQADPQIIKSPIKSDEFIVFKNRIGAGSTQELLRFVMTQTFTIPVALFLLIIMTGTMIASSIGQEKENKTLETLLTVPITRFSIVAAKMLAAAVLALVFAGFYILAFGNYMSSMTSLGGASPTDQTAQHIARSLGMILDWKGNLLLGINIFLAIIAALSMATILALFAKDAKDAQATIAPLMVMLLIPYFFSMFFDPATMSVPLKIITFLIPFSHTFFALKFILLGQFLPVILGLFYLALFSLGLLGLASYIFSSDKILTMKFSFLAKK